MGGFDFVKDDENLTSTSFNRFEDRVKYMTKLRDKAEQETGEKKSAFLNISSDVETMKKRADMLAEYGWNYAMIDVVVAGNASVMTMRDYCSDLGLAIHAHRAFHSTFDRNKKHGMTMYFLAKLMRLIGVSQIHTGTAVGKLTGTRTESILLADLLRKKKIAEVPAPVPRTGLGHPQDRIPGLVGRTAPGPRSRRARYLRQGPRAARIGRHSRPPEGNPGRGTGNHAGDRGMAGWRNTRREGKNRTGTSRSAEEMGILQAEVTDIIPVVQQVCRIRNPFLYPGQNS